MTIDPHFEACVRSAFGEIGSPEVIEQGSKEARAIFTSAAASTLRPRLSLLHAHRTGEAVTIAASSPPIAAGADDFGWASSALTGYLLAQYLGSGGRTVGLLRGPEVLVLHSRSEAGDEDLELALYRFDVAHGPGRDTVLLFCDCRSEYLDDVERKVLWARAGAGDDDALHRLVESYLSDALSQGWVGKLSHRYANPWASDPGTGDDIRSFIGEAIWRSVRSSRRRFQEGANGSGFDPFGRELLGYAWRGAERLVKEYSLERTYELLPLGLRRPAPKVLEALHRLMGRPDRLDWDETIRTIAAELALTIEQVAAVLDHASDVILRFDDPDTRLQLADEDLDPETVLALDRLRARLPLRQLTSWRFHGDRTSQEIADLLTVLENEWTLHLLTDAEREVVLRRHIELMTIEEVANDLGIPREHAEAFERDAMITIRAALLKLLGHSDEEIAGRLKIDPSRVYASSPPPHLVPDEPPRRPVTADVVRREQLQAQRTIRLIGAYLEMNGDSDPQSFLVWLGPEERETVTLAFSSKAEGPIDAATLGVLGKATVLVLWLTRARNPAEIGRDLKLEGSAAAACRVLLEWIRASRWLFPALTAGGRGEVVAVLRGFRRSAETAPSAGQDLVRVAAWRLALEQALPDPVIARSLQRSVDEITKVLAIVEAWFDTSRDHLGDLPPSDREVVEQSFERSLGDDRVAEMVEIPLARIRRRRVIAMKVLFRRRVTSGD